MGLEKDTGRLTFQDVPEHYVFRCMDTTRLLLELLRRNTLHEWPTQTLRDGSGYQATIGIGKDNSADICVSDDDLQALLEIERQSQ